VRDGAAVSLRGPTVSSRKTIRDAKSAQERMRQEKRRPAALEMTSRGRRSKKSDPVGGAP